MPQKHAGMRILPAISLPTPRMEPFPPIMAPSPPEEPPGDLVELCGLQVSPKIGLAQAKLVDKCVNSIRVFGNAHLASPKCDAINE